MTNTEEQDELTNLAVVAYGNIINAISMAHNVINIIGPKASENTTEEEAEKLFRNVDGALNFGIEVMVHNTIEKLKELEATDDDIAAFVYSVKVGISDYQKRTSEQPQPKKQ